jgi:hypothetical protein
MNAKKTRLAGALTEFEADEPERDDDLTNLRKLTNYILS